MVKGTKGSRRITRGETDGTRIRERTGERIGDGDRGHEIRLIGGGREVGRGRGVSHGLEVAGGIRARTEMGGRGGIGGIANGQRVESGIALGEVCYELCLGQLVRSTNELR